MRWKVLPSIISALLATAVFNSGCGGSSAKDASDESSNSTANAPNIILISIDTLRADHLGTYGYFRDTSPNLDRLAGEGIVFDSAFTVMSHTLPAHLSLMTGLHPSTHGVLSNGWSYAGSYPLLAERLAEVGYSTAGVVSGIPLNRESGIARGFATYEDTRGVAEQPLPKIPGEIVNERALAWLEERPAGPYFLFLHYFDVHCPYETPPNTKLPFEADGGLRSHARSLGVIDLRIADVSPTPVKSDGRELPDVLSSINAYDNQVFRVDALIGELLSTLRTRDDLDDTLLIVTSDHGEGLGQHGYYKHGFHLYEEQVHVPLIVRHFGGSWPARRVGAVTSLLDVVPTLFAILGITPDDGLQGRSMLSVMRDGTPPESGRWLLMQRRTYSERGLKTRGRFASRIPLFALRGDDPLKYLLDGKGRQEIYDLQSDARELHSLVSDRAAECKRLRKELEAIRTRYTESAIKPDMTIDPEKERALRSLGYLP